MTKNAKKKHVKRRKCKPIHLNADRKPFERNNDDDGDEIN